MKSVSLEHAALAELLTRAGRQWTVYAPLRGTGGDVELEPLPGTAAGVAAAFGRLAGGSESPVIAPKELFFPQWESLFEFRGAQTRATPEASPKLLFGIAACDLAGLRFADEFFRRRVDDYYYRSRLRNRFIITRVCPAPPRPRACFCASAKTGPFASAGFDLQLLEAGDRYHVEVGSARGAAFVRKFRSCFAAAPVGAAREIKALKRRAAAAVELQVPFRRALQLMKKDEFVPEENYRRIGERCIYCGACLYTCPTCTCFNVVDRGTARRGGRFRNWDACVFSGYTREASGHNPRAEKWLRTARRYEHKLKYDPRVAGASGCVGCGRCLASCPVGIGISEFIREIAEGRRIL